MIFDQMVYISTYLKKFEKKKGFEGSLWVFGLSIYLRSKDTLKKKIRCPIFEFGGEGIVM